MSVFEKACLLIRACLAVNLCSAKIETKLNGELVDNTLSPHLSLIAIALFALQGCSTNVFGLAASTYSTHKNSHDTFAIGQHKPQIVTTANPRSLTPEELVQKWGEPQAIKQYQQCEVYVYQDGFSWSGVGMYIWTLPLPLLVPSGVDELEIYFKQGVAIQAVEEFGKMNTLYGVICDAESCGTRFSPRPEKVKNINLSECEDNTSQLSL